MKTREERFAESRAYYQAHKAEIVAKAKARYQAHKAEIDARTKARYQAHKEEINAKAKAYYQAHKAEIAAYHRAHREERRIAAMKYRKEHDLHQVIRKRLEARANTIEEYSYRDGLTHYRKWDKTGKIYIDVSKTIFLAKTGSAFQLAVRDNISRGMTGKSRPHGPVINHCNMKLRYDYFLAGQPIDIAKEAIRNKRSISNMMFWCRFNKFGYSRTVIPGQ